MQTIATTMDPMADHGRGATTSPIPLYEGVLPEFTCRLPRLATRTRADRLRCRRITRPSSRRCADRDRLRRPAPYYWVCLRRPANLFAPVSPTNPMVVVDSVRFPYIDGTGPLTTDDDHRREPTATATTTSAPTLFGPAVSAVSRRARGAGAAADGELTPPAAPTSPTPVDPRYGYTEQIVVPGGELAACDDARHLLHRRAAPPTIRDAADLPHAGLGQ